MSFNGNALSFIFSRNWMCSRICCYYI